MKTSVNPDHKVVAHKVTIRFLIGLCMLAVFSLSAAAAPLPGSRIRLNFNVGWTFFLGTPAGTPSDADFNDSSWTSISIPHTLKLTSLNLDGSTDNDTQKTFHRYVGWYRKHFRVDTKRDAKVFLEFEGANQVTDVWVNGQYVGKNAVSGYTPFSFDISEMLKVGKDNVVAVRVDNTRNVDVPPDGGAFDYILFGGLYRNVFLDITDKLHVTFPWDDTYAGIFVTTPTVNPTNATISVRSTVRNEYDAKKSVTIVTRILDANRKVVLKMSQTRQVPVGADQTIIQTGVLMDDLNLWTLDTPYIYTAHTTVLSGETPVDIMETPFGIRKCELVPDKGFMLNGQKLELIGVDWHQMYPYVGNAVPDSLREKDATRLKAAGIRIIRLAHYPHADAFIDACDRLGMFVYAEPPTWMSFGNETWTKNLEEAMRRMVRNYRNHPSVLFYGASLNHYGPMDDLQAIAKEEDPTRITSSNGTNWVGPLDAGPTDLYSRMIFHGLATSEPYLLGIEANGSRDAETDQKEISTFMGSPRLIGRMLWNGNDYNTFRNARHISHSGMIDLFGIPKDQYYWYQSEFTSDPMIHIATRWNGVATAARFGRDAQPVSPGRVRIFSDCDEIELLLNGVSVGRHGPDRTPEKSNLKHPSFLFDLTYKPGELKAIGYINGHARVNQVVRTPETPDHLLVEADTAGRTFTADGADMVFAYAHVQDKNGTDVPSADIRVVFTVSGPAVVVGGADIESNPVVAENGIARILLRSGLKPGMIRLAATTDGLPTASTTLMSIPFQEDITEITQPPYFEPLRIKIDLGKTGQLTQPGWTAWSGSSQADQTRKFDALNGATIALANADGVGTVIWSITPSNGPHMTGTLNYMVDDGTTVSAADGLSLTFKGLKPGHYTLTTYHHIPPYANLPVASSSKPRAGTTRPAGATVASDETMPTGVKVSAGTPINIFVDDAEGKNRLVAAEVHPSTKRPLDTPASAIFTFTTDATGLATVRMVGSITSGDIWLNGFVLEQLPR